MIKMAVLIFVFLVFGDIWARIKSYEQCCYSYGSVPHNENNSVPGGMEFSLNGIIYHPRDVYTNLTVKWFKSNAPPTLTGVSARPEMISDNHSDYNFSRLVLNSTRNCIEGPLYRDTFSLRILNFTTDKSGYYWYQLFINGSAYQPSLYALFYADYDLHTQTQGHFKLADENQCANATDLITSPPITMLTSTVAPKIIEAGINPVYYAIGGLIVLMVLFAILTIIIILLMFMYKRHKKHRQKSERSRSGTPVHKPVNTCTPNLDSAAIHSQILLHISDSREDGTYSIVSDKNQDAQQDHTYDTAQFKNQNTISSNEQPQYSTLQHENGTNIPTWSNSTTILFDTYEKINTAVSDGQNRSNLNQSRTTHRMDSGSEYDVVENSRTQNVLNQSYIGVSETNKMMPQDYESVYCNNFGSSNPQTTELTRKQMLFDNKTYGAHRPVPRRVAVHLGVDGGEDKPNSETVKKETPIANKEVQYAEPLTPNDKDHAQDMQAEGEHFYHSLELNKPTNIEKYISGHAMDEGHATNAPISFNFDHCEFDDPMYKGIPHIMVPKQTNNTLSKMYHDKIAFPDEVSCTGDVNVHPDMLSLEEDNNTPGYSDPDWLDDTNISNGQKDTRFRAD